MLEHIRSNLWEILVGSYNLTISFTIQQDINVFEMMKSASEKTFHFHLENIENIDADELFFSVSVSTN